MANLRAAIAEDIAEGASDTADGAVTVAGSAVETANDAVSLASGAVTTADAAALATNKVKVLNAIGDSYTIPSVIISATDSGGGMASIIVANHIRRYPDSSFPDVSITGTTIAGVPNGVTRAVYYDDVTLSNPTPTIQITDDIAVGQVGYVLGRHSLGSVTTPAAGGTGTGGGYYPPGGTPIPKNDDS